MPHSPRTLLAVTACGDLGVLAAPSDPECSSWAWHGALGFMCLSITAPGAGPPKPTGHLHARQRKILPSHKPFPFHLLEKFPVPLPLQSRT